MSTSGEKEQELDVPAARPDPRAEGGFETLCAHYGEHRLAHGGGASPPIYQSSTFVYPDAEAFAGRDRADTPYYDYTRRSNPTTAILEAKLARLEQGTWARCFSSGMGAITAAINMCVKTDAHVVIVADCYQPTRRYLTEYLNRFDVQATFVRGTNPADFIAALRDETHLIYLESPTSGRFDVIDLAPIVAAARQRGITTMLDNSWSTPYFQQPLELGIDLVVHSATKFISGHSDTLGGVAAGRDDELRQRLCPEAELLGASIDPFAAWLLIRGLRTLGLRMEQHQRSGLAVARLLAAHGAVQCVYYPGLESCPQHAVAQHQMRGFSGMLSFALRDQTREATHRFMDRLRVFSIGCSWGGYESLVVGGPSRELFNDNPAEPAWIIRLHCGLESTQDLVDDVRQALQE
jgi:cystathionine beta-lyase